MSTQQRRADAIVTAQNALRGAPLTRTDAKRVGEDLKDDMTAWRDTFKFGVPVGKRCGIGAF